MTPEQSRERARKARLKAETFPAEREEYLALARELEALAAALEGERDPVAKRPKA